MSRPSHPPKERPVEELVRELELHLQLLKSYHRKCFSEKNIRYSGEVAAKIRLLVTDRYRPRYGLLLRVVDRFEIDENAIGFRMGDGPRPYRNLPDPGKLLDIESYMDLPCWSVTLDDGEFVTLTRGELATGWAQQTGAAHVDSAMSPELRKVLEAPFIFNGQSGALGTLQEISQTTINIADRVVARVRS